jgi:hypothetical protein
VINRRTLLKRGGGLAAGLASVLLVASCTTVPAGSEKGLFSRNKTPPAKLTDDVAPSAAGTQFAFASITGAPSEFQTRLAGALGRQAAMQGLQIVPESSGTATYNIRGFVSISSTPKNSLIHVWDVEKRDGIRAQRLSRETELPADMAMTPWPIVDQTIVDQVATDVVRTLLDWQKQLATSG